MAKKADKQNALTTLDQIKPAPYNPRKISEKARFGLAESLKRFGDLSGIVWNSRTGNQVAGHQRLAQLQKVHGDGLTFDPVKQHILTPSGEEFRVRVVDWPLEKEKAANVAANSPTIQGEWNEDIEALLREIKNDDADLHYMLGNDDLADVLKIDLRDALPYLSGPAVDADGLEPPRAPGDGVATSHGPDGQTDGNPDRERNEMRGAIPLSIVLTPDENVDWRAVKTKLGTASDKTAMLILMRLQLPDK